MTIPRTHKVCTSCLHRLGGTLTPLQAVTPTTVTELRSAPYQCTRLGTFQLLRWQRLRSPITFRSVRPGSPITFRSVRPAARGGRSRDYVARGDDGEDDMKMSCPKTGESSRYSSDRAATNESAPCTRTRGRQHILRTRARPECITWLLKQTKPT